MFSVLMTLFTAVLFYALVPGIFLTFPQGGSKTVVAFTHGLLFALLYHLIHKAVWYSLVGNGKYNEGFAMCGGYTMGSCPANKTCKATGTSSNFKYQCTQY